MTGVVVNETVLPNYAFPATVSRLDAIEVGIEKRPFVEAEIQIAFRDGLQSLLVRLPAEHREFFERHPVLILTLTPMPSAQRV